MNKISEPFLFKFSQVLVMASGVKSVNIAIN